MLMSRKIHIREGKLTNKLTIKRNIYFNGAKLLRAKNHNPASLKVDLKIDPEG